MFDAFVVHIVLVAMGLISVAFVLLSYIGIKIQKTARVLILFIVPLVAALIIINLICQ